MEVVTVLSIIEGIISLTGKFRDLITQERLVEKDKDGFFGKVGELLDQLRFSKDIDTKFEYFVGEELEGWLSQLRKSRDMDALGSVWGKIYERFDKHIVLGVGQHLPRMKSIASKQSSMKLDEIPLVIRNQARNLAQLYPELIQLIEEFMKGVEKQSKEIKQENFKNIGETALTLDRQSKRIKMIANALLRDLCSIIIYVYDQLTGG